MKRKLIIGTLATFLLALAIYLAPTDSAMPLDKDSVPQSNVFRVNAHSQKAFLQNKGQMGSPAEIVYYIETDEVGLYISPKGMEYVWIHSGSDKEGLVKSQGFRAEKLEMRWLGANPHPNILATDSLPYFRHFYTGEDPKGITHVPSFQRILYEDLYPQIDLLLYFKEGQLKYDFVVKPGGDPSDIQLSYSGQDRIEEASDGSLHLINSLGSLQEGKPYSFQQKNGEEIPINSRYKVEACVVTFEVEAYDKASTLIIDPTLEWATYLGGEREEYGEAVSSDPYGNVYIVGRSIDQYHELATLYDLSDTWSATDAFIAKFDASGNLLWATYVGGGDEDAGLSVDIDADGDVYMAGYTQSNEGIYQNGHDATYNDSHHNGGNRFNRDGFLAKFTSEGTRIWGTYYGGEDEEAEEARSVYVDADGDVYLAGLTSSQTQIAQNGYDNVYSGNFDAFLAKFDTNGNRLWATYYGGSERDIGNAVCVTPSGDVFLAGNTESTGLGGGSFDNSYSEDTDAFLVKFDTNGNRLWATYYGDTGWDEGHSIAVDGNNVYLAGVTSSSNFIAHNGDDMSYNGGMDAFLVKFNLFGTRVWGTFYGGPEDEARFEGIPTLRPIRSTSVSVGPQGDVYLSGVTYSESGIANDAGIDQSYGGSGDGFIARYFPGGELQWSSYFGGDHFDMIKSTTTDGSSHVYLAGYTYSDEDIAVNGHDNSYDDDGDAFLARIYPYGKSSDHPGEGGGLKNPSDDPPHSEELNLSISPNPSKREIEVHFPGKEEGPFQIEILDKAGQQIYLSKKLEGPLSEKVDLAHLRKGIYTLILHGSREKYTAEIQKN